MNIFVENYCRICSEFFCCKECRANHEENYHKIFPECDICIYGKALLKDPCKKLLEHLKLEHWPLQCLSCKIQFVTIKELSLHTLCRTAPKKSLKEMPNFVSESDSIEPNYDSPPLAALLLHKSILTSSNKQTVGDGRFFLTTSTPMQNTNERALQQIPEVITPVDYTEKNDLTEKLSTLGNGTKFHPVPDTSNEQSSKRNQLPYKRRVTFSDIEITNIETPHQRRKVKYYIPSYEMNLELENSNSTSTFDIYTTACDETPVSKKMEALGNSVIDTSSDCYETAIIENSNDGQRSSQEYLLAELDHKLMQPVDYIDLTQEEEPNQLQHKNTSTTHAEDNKTSALEKLNRDYMYLPVCDSADAKRPRDEENGTDDEGQRFKVLKAVHSVNTSTQTE